MEKDHRTKECILIIDDSDITRTILRKILENNGYKVVEASDGKKGINICRENAFDLVITDIIMPEKEGLETIRELKMDYPEIKIVAISGGGRASPDDYLPLAKMFGAKQTLAKPIEPNDLLKAVKEVLR